MAYGYVVTVSTFHCLISQICLYRRAFLPSLVVFITEGLLVVISSNKSDLIIQYYYLELQINFVHGINGRGIVINSMSHHY